MVGVLESRVRRARHCYGQNIEAGSPAPHRAGARQSTKGVFWVVVGMQKKRVKRQPLTHPLSEICGCCRYQQQHCSSIAMRDASHVRCLSAVYLCASRQHSTSTDTGKSARVTGDHLVEYVL